MKANDTPDRLNAALHRLLKGRPIRTKADGRISISRINQEAGLSQGAVYYYKEFVEAAKEAIKRHRRALLIQDECAESVTSNGPTNSLVDTFKTERRLKKKYRDQRDDLKASMDQLVITNVSLAFRVLELEGENRHLIKGKLVEIRGGRGSESDKA